MWVRPWCLLVIIWTVFAQPCGRARKAYPEKVDCSFLKIDTFSLLKTKPKKNKLFLYWFIMCVCMSPFAHVKVRGQLARVSSAIWVLWTALSGLVAWAFAH